MSKADLIREHPAFPWLDLDDPRGIEQFLRDHDWIEPDESVVACEKPGDGNMNLTIRVRTESRSFIVKQARPWVEKYDHIPAPWDRADFERRFYQRVAGIAGVADRMPRLLAADAESRTLVLEDLGEAASLVSLYAGDVLDLDELRALARYLRALHDATRGKADPTFGNCAMRRLNHQHVFVVPLAADNGLKLDAFEPGLERAAGRLRDDEEYRSLVEQTGNRYLADGPCLVHGDFFPGSWLRAADGVRVIDPEFCYFGDVELDLGCAVAHFALAWQPRASAAALLKLYDAAGEPAAVDATLLARYAACEVMRRLIGVAQLPLPPRGTRRCALLARSRRTMLDGAWELLWE